MTCPSLKAKFLAEVNGLVLDLNLLLNIRVLITISSSFVYANICTVAYCVLMLGS